MALFLSLTGRQKRIVDSGQSLDSIVVVFSPRRLLVGLRGAEAEVEGYVCKMPHKCFVHFLNMEIMKIFSGRVVAPGIYTHIKGLQRLLWVGLTHVRGVRGQCIKMFKCNEPA